MKALFDECFGRRVPEAYGLMQLCEVERLRQRFPEKGVKDIDWIPIIGPEGWLIISHNEEMLQIVEERAAIIENAAGIVFVKQAKTTMRDRLMFLLRRHEWLEEIDALPRPFAFVTTVRGRPRRVDL